MCVCVRHEIKKERQYCARKSLHYVEIDAHFYSYDFQMLHFHWYNSGVYFLISAARMRLTRTKQVIELLWRWHFFFNILVQQQKWVENIFVTVTNCLVIFSMWILLSFLRYFFHHIFMCVVFLFHFILLSLFCFHYV